MGDSRVIDAEVASYGGFTLDSSHVPVGVHPSPVSVDGADYLLGTRPHSETQAGRQGVASAGKSGRRSVPSLAPPLASSRNQLAVNNNARTPSSARSDGVKAWDVGANPSLPKL